MNDDNENSINRVIYILIITSILTIVLNIIFFKHEEDLVYITNTGKCYHSANCSYLKSQKPIGLEEAKNKGYTSCSRCHGEPNGTIEVNNYWGALFVAIIIEIIGGFIIIDYKKETKNSTEIASNRDYISSNNNLQNGDNDNFSENLSEDFLLSSSNNIYIDKNDEDEEIEKDYLGEDEEIEKDYLGEDEGIEENYFDEDDEIEKSAKDIIQPYQLNGNHIYFILSDLYGTFDEILLILEEKGFVENNNNHIVIINGSISTLNKPFSKFTLFYDRMKKLNRIILIKNDIDENIISIYNRISKCEKNILYNSYNTYKIYNSIELLAHLIGVKLVTYYDNIELYNTRVGNSKIYKIISNDVNSFFYFEIGSYIITHAWIPLDITSNETYIYKTSWRHAKYNEWRKALKNVDDLIAIPNKKIINTANWYDEYILFDDSSPMPKYIYETKDYINIHGDSNVNCLVLKQENNGLSRVQIGEKNIGYFFRHGDDILYEKEVIDCDIEYNSEIIKGNKNIEDVWKRISLIQLDGKYSKYNYDDLLYGEVWFDKSKLTYKMHLYIPKKGYIKINNKFGLSNYVYMDSINNVEYRENLNGIDEGLVAITFDAYGLELDTSNLDSN